MEFETGYRGGGGAMFRNGQADYYNLGTGVTLRKKKLEGQSDYGRDLGRIPKNKGRRMDKGQREETMMEY